MANISGYSVRTSVALSDRIFVASAASDVIQSCTLGQVVGLVSGGSGPAYAPGWGKSYAGGSWARPASAAFTSFGTTGATGTAPTVTDLAGGPLRTTYANGSGTWSGLKQAISGASWTLEAFVTVEALLTGSGASTGLLLVNSSSGAFVAFVIFGNGQLYIQHWGGFNGTQGFTSNVYNASLYTSPTQLHFRVVFDGTNLTFYVADDPTDDFSWSKLYTETVSSFIGSVDTIGFGANTSAPGTAGVNLYGWTVTTP